MFARCRYNSNTAHQHEVDDMLEAMEEVLFQHGVDAVFAGHVHAYERGHRTYKCARMPIFFCMLGRKGEHSIMHRSPPCCSSTLPSILLRRWAGAGLD